jgi:hypothetical protein
LRAAILTGLVCAFVVISGCGYLGNSQPNGSAAKIAKPAAPAIPPEVRSVVQTALGADAEAVAWGDLALTGHQQILAVNRVYAQGAAAVPGLVVSRLAVLESDGPRWKEVLGCDEHMKNPNGYLGGTPSADVSAWRVQYQKDPKLGLMLFFTPYKQGPTVPAQTIEVRWNPEAHRYQAMDATYENFIGESPAIEPVHRDLIK